MYSTPNPINQNYSHQTKTITEDNKHLLPKDMLEVYEYIMARPIVFPERYLRAQKGHLKRKVRKLYQQQSELSPKMVLMTLLEPLPDFIPLDMMTQLCTHILDCWQQKVEEEKEQIAET